MSNCHGPQNRKQLQAFRSATVPCGAVSNPKPYPKPALGSVRRSTLSLPHEPGLRAWCSGRRPASLPASTALPRRVRRSSARSGLKGGSSRPAAGAAWASSSSRACGANWWVPRAFCRRPGSQCCRCEGEKGRRGRGKWERERERMGGERKRGQTTAFSSIYNRVLEHLDGSKMFRLGRRCGLVPPERVVIVGVRGRSCGRSKSTAPPQSRA